MPSFFPPKGSFHVLSEISFGYYIHEADESTTTRYYGYVDHRGAWIIMRQVTTTGVHRYAAGKSGFAAAWIAKAIQTYGYFNDIV